MSGARKTEDLVEHLRAALPPERRPELEAVEGLEVLLRRHLTAARTRWPTPSLSDERFVRYLAARLPAGKVSEVMRVLRAEDLYLACACASGEPTALEDFERHILRHLPARLARLSPSMRQEVLQVVRERLLVANGDTPPRIASYGGRGPLLSWVGIVAARISGELMDRDTHLQLVAESPEELARHLSPRDPECALLREDARRLLAESLRRAVSVLSEQERTLLSLHHLHGFTLDRLTRMYGGSRSGIARRVAATRKQLLERVRLELAPRLKHDVLALESLLGLLGSRLELSLKGLLD
ncbi:RNA polymerase subunit sigma-70 [Myxococcus sp. K38C18041901]|uniref:RNA polymerase subunit sigma-70 n=1 Tax=Myxococcus guangdongensis TaxID=2906760 RepID=UPI0020A7F672|nr:RNA polymerase subunit sigma-70 [Myxococcus guangdongensis]MCP3064187.1 RNA polymerase subunit sigma-70 [Myxococcus guangdongensis]